MEQDSVIKTESKLQTEREREANRSGAGRGGSATSKALEAGRSQ